MRHDRRNRSLDFLLYPVGANKQILKRRDCQTEVDKQAREIFFQTNNQ